MNQNSIINRESLGIPSIGLSSVSDGAIELNLLLPDRGIHLNDTEQVFKQKADATPAKRIRNDIAYSAMALYLFIENKNGYHNIEHTGDTLRFSDWVLHKEMLREAFRITEDLNRYNATVAKNEQITLEELPGLFGIVWLVHDMGNNGRLDPRLTNVMIDHVNSPDSKLGGFADAANVALQGNVPSILPNYNNSGLIPVEHSEVDAVDNSRLIAEFLLTYTISTWVAAAEINEEEGKMLLKRYSSFIDSMISYTVMNVQDESQRIRNGTLLPLEAFVKTLDRVATYAGKTDGEVWKKITALAREKVKDGEHATLTREELFNFASNTLTIFYQEDAKNIRDALKSQGLEIPQREYSEGDGNRERYDWYEIAKF